MLNATSLSAIHGPIKDYYDTMSVYPMKTIVGGKKTWNQELEIVFKVKQLRFESCKLERPMFIYLPMSNSYANVSLRAPTQTVLGWSSIFAMNAAGERRQKDNNSPFSNWLQLPLLNMPLPFNDDEEQSHPNWIALHFAIETHLQ